MDLKAAFIFSHELHAGQKKNGTEIPFLYHPMAVAALVLKYGGTPAQASAALLHATIADSRVTPERLTERFGAEVAQLTFAFAPPPPTPEIFDDWHGRKVALLSQFAKLDASALLLVACEARVEMDELLHDLRYEGISVWDRYPVHAMEVAWYFKALLPVLYERLTAPKEKPLVSEFAQRVRQLNNIVFEAKGK